MSDARFAAEDWRRLEAAFARAADLDGAERARFLAGLTDWPEELRAELAALLEASAAPSAAAAALEAPAVQALGFALQGGAVRRTGLAKPWAGAGASRR